MRKESDRLLGRKSMLLGALASGVAAVSVAQAPAASARTVRRGARTVRPVAATPPDTALTWAPATIYALGQQVVSPNNDIVSANVAHTSSAAYASDLALWTLSSTYALAGGASGAGLAIVSPNSDGTYTKPAGTPMYLAFQAAARLPADWSYCLSTASTLDTASMGTCKALGTPAEALETEWSGITPVTWDDGTLVCAAPASAAKYRSEAIFTSDRTDAANTYTNFRFTEGQRVRIAFDVMTQGLDAQDASAWNLIFQSLGPAGNGAWGMTPLSINIEHGNWVIQGGLNSPTRSELLPRTIHEDGRWTRFELDILLGRANVGYVSVWKDAEQLAYQWKPTSGTFYAGTGNSALDLQWIYFKNGLYGQPTTSPLAVTALFRNRRFSVTAAGGASTTTWRGPQTHGPGLNVYRRNPVSDMPY